MPEGAVSSVGEPAPQAAAAKAVAAETGKLKVFISYSRRDLAFADQLAAVLEWQGFAVSIDRKGIHGAEDWEARLGQLILEADTVVFVLSPDAAVSPACHWEVEEALRRNKRFVPILCRALDGAQPHPRLRDLNYIHFYGEPDVPGSGFGTGQVRLIEALKIDVEWLREHTRFEELAARWDKSERAVDLLVRGSELAAYKSWRDRRPADAPDLTALQRAFLGASEAEEVSRASAERRRIEEMAAANETAAKALADAQAALAREAAAQQARARARRIIQWGSAAVALVLVAGAVGFGIREAENGRVQAELSRQNLKERNEAVTQSRIATAKTKEAEANLERAFASLRTESVLRASQARAADERGDTVTAMLVALEALPDKANGIERPFVADAWGVLYEGYLQQHGHEGMPGHPGDVTSAAFSPDGRHIVTASDDNTARLWEPGSGAGLSTKWRTVAILSGHTGEVRSAAFSTDGRRILTASDDRTARLWEFSSLPGPSTEWRTIATLSDHTDRVLNATFSPDGHRIVTASDDGTARLWEPGSWAGPNAEWRTIATFSGHTGPVVSAAFSPDGARIVTASSDRTARLWDADGRPLATLSGHIRGVRMAVFSPDGRRILTASYDQTARLWDADGKPLATLAGHTDTVWSAAFSPDGARIVTASDDRTARLWDADGKPIATLQGHTDAVVSAAFSPDGAVIITASADRTARIWPAYPDPDELVQIAKQRVPRCLTPKQRADLFLAPEPPAWCKAMGKWPYDPATLAAEAAAAATATTPR